MGNLIKEQICVRGASVDVVVPWSNGLEEHPLKGFYGAETG